MRAVFDTNILIDYLNGLAPARLEIGKFDDRRISILTWMEVMVGASDEEEPAVRGFLGGFDVVGVDAAIAERAVQLRRTHRLRLPDAIIWATARVNSALLVTRDARDFPATDPGIRIPYTVKGRARQ